ncbi:MAG: type II secretion system ATPase GspE [Rhodospirillales bacterium]|jgi:general secretion pathway protein E|nr:type II secretion system ATPase GspE [Rhodospirillales bacterium]
MDAPVVDRPAAAAVIERLVERGKVDAAAVDRARRVAGERQALHLILVKLGLVDEKDVAEALAQVLHLPLVAAADFPEEPVLDNAVSLKFLKEARALPIADSDEGLVVALADPLDTYVTDALALAVGRPVVCRVGVPAEIERAFERLYGGGGNAGGIRQIVEGMGDAVIDGADEDAERLKDLASEAPVIRLVNHLISRAVDARASDIHIEPFENSLRIRYRIDGVLQEVETPPLGLKSAIVSRVKIMAKLNIAERRLPQDGRIKLAIRGKEIDFRISTLPTMYGESVVMRILDKSSNIFDFSVLGFGQHTLTAFLDVLERPNGILLVTGPTGSGKTTTLYTSLLRINTPDKKILTVEDPVEYQLEGVNQVQVKAQIGLTFAHVLRAILRQDPDIVMIGEIRDLETAQIAAQAALTGHLVLSTLHTNSAAATITRLLDMGLEDYLMASTINGIAAQRLVRSLCPECRVPHPAAAELIAEFELERVARGQPISLYKPVGCAACSGTGYYGRTAIAEILVMSEAVRRLTLKRAEAGEIQRAAVEMGMRTLYEDGLRKVVSGLTSVEEVLRVTRDT